MLLTERDGAKTLVNLAGIEQMSPMTRQGGCVIQFLSGRTKEVREDPEAVFKLIDGLP